jgi:ketosteroid isomerase-like protein
MLVLLAMCLFATTLSQSHAAEPPRGLALGGMAKTSSTERSSADVSAIRGEIERFRQSVLRKDMSGISRYYWHSPQLVVFDVITPLSYVGWDSFREDWEGFFVDFRTISLYDWTDVQVEASGDLGYVRAFIHMKGELKNGEQLEMKVRDTAIFRRIDGRWVVVHDHGSVPFDSFQSRRAIVNATSH